MKVLTSREAAVVDAIGITLFPPGGPIDLDSRDVGVVEYIDDLMAKVPLQERLLLRAMFALFELGPTLIPSGRPGLFTRLTPEQRLRHLARWENSRIWLRRTAFSALRSAMLMAYAGNDRFEEAIEVEDGVQAVRAWRQRKGMSRPKPAEARPQEAV